ncbi:MAG: acyl-CoA dehydrogenase family protein [Pseudomonadota bacterium]
MDFSLSEEQVLLRDSVDRFVSERCTVDRLRKLRADPLGFDPAAWRTFAELGWLSLPFPEPLGGFGGRATDLMTICEAMGRGCVREPYLTNVIVCGGLLRAFATEQQQAEYIPTIIDGSTQWAFAFAETGSDFELGNATLVAVAEDNQWSLTGEKIAVLNGHCADYLLVTGYDGTDLALYLVDANTDGIYREPFVAVDDSRGASIRFDRAAGIKLSAERRPVAALYGAIDLAHVAIGGEAVGAMQALLDLTVEYTKTREQFGQAIGKFQVLQHRMADMYMKVEETRSLLFNAAIRLEQGSLAADLACAALRVKVAEAGRRVAQEAVQLHGGIGMTDELAVSHYYKRLLLLGKLFGDERFHLQRYATLSAGMRAEPAA